MSHTVLGVKMGSSHGIAFEVEPGVVPEWIDFHSYPPSQAGYRSSGLFCLELSEASLADGCRWIKAAQEIRWSKDRSLANILVATRSLALQWRVRESIRQQVTNAGAALLEVEPHQNPHDVLREWLADA